MSILQASGHLTLKEIRDAMPTVHSSFNHVSMNGMYGTASGVNIGVNPASPDGHLKLSDFYGKNIEFVNIPSGGYIYGGADSIITNSVQSTGYIRYVVDPTKTYRMEVDLTSVGSVLSKMYCVLNCFDIYGSQSNHIESHYFVNTATTLAVDLVYGDYTVQLTDATNWIVRTSYYNNNVLYTHPDKPYAPYTRMYNLGTFNNIVGNTLDMVHDNTTTPKMYTGVTLPAGTPVGTGWNGSSYVYPAATGNTIPAVETHYTQDITGDPINGDSVSQFRPGTAYVSIGLLANYAQTSTSSIRIRNYRFFEL